MVDISNLFVAGIPMTLVVFGLVEFIKSFGLSGKIVTALSMVVGLIIGIGYQLSIAVPVGFNGWYPVIIFGITIGLVASGFYKFIDSRKPIA